jgi:uncharacterized membrane protein
MVVMAVDHCDLFYNSHHAAGDSAGFRQPFPLSPPDFLTRWCTHLCAPSFVFLAGAGMAISAANSARRGHSAASIDRYLLQRGLVLFGIEVFYLSLMSSSMHGSPAVFLQVIYALGACMIAMTPLRRLSSSGLVIGAAALLVVCEVAYGQFAGGDYSLPTLLALLPGRWSPRGDGFDAPLTVLYPALPWLPAMMLGWAFGRRLASDREPMRPLWLGGLALLVLFAVVRGADGFGNMGMHRRDASALEWLNCSKYPPSIAFFAMELGPHVAAARGVLSAAAPSAARGELEPAARDRPGADVLLPRALSDDRRLGRARRLHETTTVVDELGRCAVHGRRAAAPLWRLSLVQADEETRLDTLSVNAPVPSSGQRRWRLRPK